MNKIPRIQKYFYIITGLSIILLIVLFLTDKYKFAWLLKFDYGSMMMGKKFGAWLFGRIIGKIILFLPTASLIGSFLVKKRWYFVLFSIINTILVLFQILLTIIPYS